MNLSKVNKNNPHVIPVKFDLYLGMVVYGVILFGKFLPLGTASILCYILFLFSFLIRQSRFSRISILIFLVISILTTFQLLVSFMNNMDRFLVIITDANYYISGFVLFFYIINKYRVDELGYNRFLYGVIIISLVASITSIFNFFTTHMLSYDFIYEFRVIGEQQQQWTYRLIGWAGNPNNFAYFLGFPLVCSLYFSMLYRKIVYFVASFIIFFAIIFTASRGVIAPLLVVMSYFLIISFSSSVKYNKVALLVNFTVPFFVFGLLAIYLNQSDRFVELADRLLLSDGVASNQNRGSIWLNYFTYFSHNLDSFLLGSGYGNFLTVPPDNSYIRVTYTFGALVLVIILSVLLGYIVTYWRGMSCLSKALLVYLVLSSFFNDWVVSKTFWVTLAFMVILTSFRAYDAFQFNNANQKMMRG